MATNPNLTDQDYELLSAYLDNQLTGAERTALEARLQAEPDLRRELASLRQTRALVHQLPRLKAPRDFTLDASFARAPRARRVLAFPAAFSALSAAAAVVLFLFGGYFLTRSSFQAAPPAHTVPQVAHIPTLAVVTDQVGAISAAPAAADFAPDEAVEQAAPGTQPADEETAPFAAAIPYGTGSPPAAFVQEAMEDEATEEAEADAPPSVMRAVEPTSEAALTEPDAIVDPREQLLPPTRLPPAAGADAAEETAMMQAEAEEADGDAANSATTTMAEAPPVTAEPPLPTSAPTPSLPAADDRALGAALLALGAALLAFAAITTAVRQRMRR